MSRTLAQRKPPARDGMIWDWRAAQRLRILEEVRLCSERPSPELRGGWHRLEVSNTAAVVKQLGEGGISGCRQVLGRK